MPQDNAPTGAAGTAAPSKASGAEVDAVKAELADLMKEAAGATKPATKSTDKPADDDKPDAAAKPDDKPDDADEADDKPAKRDDDDEPTEPERPKVDPKVARGLEAIARREKRFKSEMAQAQAQLASQRAELEQQRTEAAAALQKLASFKQRVRVDPAGVLLEHIGDLSPEDLDYAAKQLHLRAKAATNPEYRAIAERERLAREGHAKADEAARKLEEMEKRLAEKEQALAREEEIREYIGTVEAAVTPDDMPLLHKALRKNPKRTRAELREVGGYIAQQTGDPWPDAAEVAAAWEKWQRAQLAERFDLDIDAITGRKPEPKIDTPSAGEKKQRPKTISSDLGKTTKPQSAPKSWEEELAEVERELREGRASDL